MILLSIAIPAYDRPDALEFGLFRFITQIIGKYEQEVEIVVTDDATPDDRLGGVRERASRYPFVRFIRNPENVGLERNLIGCTMECTGEFLWIFGDDDFLETGDALDVVMRHLRQNTYDFFVLNRTRRSFDLDKMLSSNWMGLDPAKDVAFDGLRKFCIQYGFISVIGFISVNVFRRLPFAAIATKPYMGTMYPQLGAMVEAFPNRPTLLIGRPLICHRTQTAEEKRAALGQKRTEADFMADVAKRNALYFSHRFVTMLDRLLDCGAFEPADIPIIPENTVINGLLIDFLISAVSQSRSYEGAFTEEDSGRTQRFFDRLPLDKRRKEEIASQRANRGPN